MNELIYLFIYIYSFILEKMLSQIYKHAIVFPFTNYCVPRLSAIIELTFAVFMQKKKLNRFIAKKIIKNY